MMIEVETKTFDRRIQDLRGAAKTSMKKAVDQIGDEVLRLSVREVPHDEGILQASGRVDKDNPDYSEVGFHTPYAARLHEHPEYHFQKGRKGKYLEDPLLKNFSLWRSIVQNVLQVNLK